MMNNESRISNSIRNMAVGVVGQAAGLVLSFVCRTVFINTLQAEYLGVTGLFSSILTVLSLAELGVGGAITYSLYKPLAEKDEDRIKALMGLYAKAYRMIACTVAILGLSLVPFLDCIIKDNANVPHLTLIYLMILSSSVISYFFAYKSSIIIADQQRYITTLYDYGFNMAQNILQSVMLVLTNNFLVYLAIQIICIFFNGFFISRQADRMYPFLKSGKKVQLDKASKKSLFKNIGAMMLHRVGTVVVLSTDNILIAIYVGIYWVGLYSNYTMIMGIINNFLSQIYASVSASIGHLNAKETRGKSYSLYNTVFLLNFWIFSFCAISFWVLFNPFITMWIGSQYLLTSNIVLLIVINFFVTGMRRAVLIFRETMGLFWHDRYKPLAESVINFAASIMLVREMGIAGVLLGTFISTMATCFWIEPYILYKHGFNKPVAIHFAKYALYSAIALAAALITELACSIFTTYTLPSIAGRAVFCLVIPNGIFMILFCKTKEYEYVYSLMRGLVLNIKQLFTPGIKL